MKYEKHELAALFPPMSAEERRELRESIKRTGQIEPIVTFEKKILEGWHRYQVAMDLGIEPRILDFQTLGYSGRGIHPADFVWAMNATRRHLDKGTLAAIRIKYEMLCAKVYPTYRGAIRELSEKEKAQRAETEAQVAKAVAKRNFSVQGQGNGMRVSQKLQKLQIKTSTAQIAKEMGVDKRTVQHAIRLAAESPRKFNAVAAGRLPLHVAISELPLTDRQKKNREERAERLRQGLKLSDPIRKLVKLADKNGGKLYVEVGGYGIKLDKGWACHVEQDELDRLSGK
jgi:hypothetical protein